MAVPRRGSAAAAALARAEGKKQEAVGLLRSAADLEASMDTYPVTPGPIVLAPELLAELLLEVGQSAQELGEFQATLRTEPNRFRSLFGAGRAAEIMRDPGKAWTFYAKLVALYDWADTEALELRQAKAFLGK